MNAPNLRIVRGDATAEEVAAVVATLTAVAAARSAAPASPQPTAPANWNARARLLRAPVRPSPQGWHRAALP